DFGETGMPDQAFLAELVDYIELFLARHFRVDPVQLPERNLLKPKPLEAAMHLLAQLLRPAIRLPAVRSRPVMPALGRDDEAGGIGMQRFADQVLAHMRPIGLGRVDEIHAEIGQALEGADGLRPIRRRSPYALAGDAHGAEAEAVDPEVSTDRKLAGKRGIWLGHLKLLGSRKWRH